MSVIAFYGVSRSGKGYSQEELLLKAVSQGIPVVTNIKQTALFYETYPNSDLEFIEPIRIEDENGELKQLKLVVDFENPKRGAFYILQEIHKVYDKKTMTQPFKVGAYANKIPDHVTVFFSERGQYLDVSSGRSIQISFDTQSPALIAKWLKSHVETAIYCEKHLEFASTGLFRRTTYGGNSAMSDSANKADIQSKKLGIPYKRSVYAMYESFAYASGNITKLDESRVGNHNSLFKSKMFWFTAAALCYLIYLFISEPLIPISSQVSKPISNPKSPLPVVKSLPSSSDVVPKILPAPAAPVVVAPVSRVGVPVAGRVGSNLLVDKVYQGDKCSGKVAKGGKAYYVCFTPTNEIIYLAIKEF